jgi:23S rRNA pseudouridine1911/1915/1917 synthase
VKINLVTGRSHQIRVQFSSRGMPLLGDRKYGKDDPVENISLWSHSIGFRHPTREEVLNFRHLPPCKYPWDLFDLSKL